MPTKTTAKIPAKSTEKKASAVIGPDAIKLLSDDHKEVKKMFAEFKKMADSDDTDAKEALVAQICADLTVHTAVEEEIFYPAAREAINDGALLDEAEVEHASAKDLIAQLKAMSSSDDLYDAKVTVLGEYIEHHIKEEETEMFTKVKKAKLDLQQLGQEMSMRKGELKASMPELEKLMANPRMGDGENASKATQH